MILMKCGIRLAAVMTMAVALDGAATTSQAQTWNWIGPASGSWDTTTHWNPGTVPNSSAATVTVNNGSNAINGAVTRSVGTVNLIGTASVTVGNGARLSIHNSVSAAGPINVQATTSFTYFQPVGNVTLSGTGGSLVLSPNGMSILFDQANTNNAADSLTVFSGFTIVGAGSIGQGAGLSVSNGGLIHANTTTASLRVRPATLSNGGVLRASNGATLSIESVLNNSGTLEALAGSTIEFNGATGINGVITGTGRLRATGATTNVSLSAVRVGALEVINNATQRIGNSGASRVTTLTINTGGKLDLVGGTMIVDYTGASPAATIRAQIITGRANGAWNGPGIHSSLIATLPTHAVGYAESSQLGVTTVGGQAVDSTTIITRLTRLGDTDLDGTVGFNDLLSLAQNYSDVTTGRSWFDGDFNYDGKADFTDLLSLAQNYGLLALGSADAALQSAEVSEQFRSDVALARSIVPEPMSATAIFAAATLCLRRRR